MGSIWKTLVVGGTHNGVEFVVERMSRLPDVWQWRFKIGDKTKNGRITTRLELMAVRKVKMIIDREMRHATSMGTQNRVVADLRDVQFDEGRHQ